tara:strand:+ start:120 stop:581 length:462 start_codon:yes stop_codon:yes gene_type:complete
MKTEFVKKKDLQKNWLLIDAENAVLGRLAVISANILRGKNKVNYTPNADCGDYLVIINSDKIKLTGKKIKDKIYYKHTGFPGGLKTTTAKEMIEKGKSNNIIKYAIKRMIPKGPLGSQQLSNCMIYETDKHPHNAQKPKPIDIGAINRKNIRA